MDERDWALPDAASPFPLAFPPDLPPDDMMWVGWVVVVVGGGGGESGVGRQEASVFKLRALTIA